MFLMIRDTENDTLPASVYAIKYSSNDMAAKPQCNSWKSFVDRMETDGLGKQDFWESVLISVTTG